jgi:hypothetical protein
MWKWAGDVSRRATDHVIKTYSGKSALSEESQQRAVESLAKVRTLTAAARMAESRIERQAGNVRQLKAVG